MEYCWERRDIETHLRENFTAEELNRSVFTKPKSKISSLIELIEKAKGNGFPKS
jgi:hypothetical protein